MFHVEDVDIQWVDKQFKYWMRKGVKETGLQTQKVNYCIILILVPSDFTRLTVKLRNILNLQDNRLLIILLGRRGLLSTYFIYNYIPIMSYSLITFSQS